MTDVQLWFNIAIALLVALFSFILNLYRSKIDKIQESYVSVSSLKEYLDEMRKLHGENITRLDALSSKIDLSTTAVILEKIRNLEQDFNTLHLWKNGPLERKFELQSGLFNNLVEQLSRRVERIEQK